MKQAYLVISDSERRLVYATEVEHTDFSRIFLCQGCDKTVTLRAGFYKENGTWVDPTFVHEEGDPEECKNRAPKSFHAEEHEQLLTILKRGQNRKSLERAFNAFLEKALRDKQEYIGFSFIPFFSRQSLIIAYNAVLGENDISVVENGIFPGNRNDIKRYIRCNMHSTKIHPDPELLLNSFAAILSRPETQKYFSTSCERYIEDLIGKCKENPKFLDSMGDTNLEEYFGRIKLNLKGVLRYISLGASDELRRKILKLVIFASHEKFFVHHENVIAKSNKTFFADELRGNRSFYLRKTYDELQESRKYWIQFISRFETFLLRRVTQDQMYLRQAFRDFYANRDSLEFELIDFTLSTVFSALKVYQWYFLPQYYRSY
jgi:hypothetical protein